MSQKERDKYVQIGTGQVFYLYRDEEADRWVVDMFAGGPEGTRRVSDYRTREEAEAYMRSSSCVKEDGEG